MSAREPIFPFPMERARPVSLAEVEFDVSEPGAFDRFIEARRGDAPALYGGYGEDRGIYSASPLFDGEDEPRTVHLGIDVWTDAGTPVCTPLEAEVHSTAINDKWGDYGGTVILAHQNYFTLWGHLAHRDVLALAAGSGLAAGTAFARLGAREENGGWPPHLHLQRIEDLLGHRGDFPGVARRSERTRWLELCPDPTPLLFGGEYRDSSRER
jgi:murein DD-endopeptidase MepM/ murein hydrolase activator NlpD